MPRVIRLQERDFSLRFLLRNLAEDVLGEVVLKLTEGSHPIVNPIEQDEDGKAREKAKAKPDEQTHDEARSDGDGRRGFFHDPYLVPGIDDLRHTDVLQVIRKTIVERFLAIDLA